MSNLLSSIRRNSKGKILDYLYILDVYSVIVEKFICDENLEKHLPSSGSGVKHSQLQPEIAQAANDYRIIKTRRLD